MRLETDEEMLNMDAEAFADQMQSDLDDRFAAGYVRGMRDALHLFKRKPEPTTPTPAPNTHPVKNKARMTIGETADFTNLSRSALYYWEKKGALVPEHTPGGHRRYITKDVQRFLRDRQK